MRERASAMAFTSSTSRRIQEESKLGLARCTSSGGLLGFAPVGDVGLFAQANLVDAEQGFQNPDVENGDIQRVPQAAALIQTTDAEPARP